MSLFDTKNISPPESKASQKNLLPEPAEVIDIILDSNHPTYKSIEDIGRIKFRRIYTQLDLSEDKCLWAKPLMPFIKMFPVLHEIVIVFSGITSNKSMSSFHETYYLSPSNIFNNISANEYVDISITPNNNKTQPNSSDYNSQTGNPNQSQGNTKAFGDTFQKNTMQQILQPYEGDVIMQGRFGQGIRFGSTVLKAKTKNPWSSIGTDGDPILIITNTKPTQQSKNPIIEDINKDSSSIYLCEGQKITINYISKNLKSYGVSQAGNTLSIPAPEYFNKYEGKQIIIDSDRLLFHAKKDGVYLNSNKTIGLSTKGTINLDADTGIILNSPLMYLGARGIDAALKGTKYINEVMTPLLTTLINLKIVSPFGPLMPTPDSITQFTNILNKLQLMLSKKVYIE